MPARETHKRTIVKTVTYRAAIILADIVVIYATTRRVDITVGLTLFTNLASTAIYYLHERVWNVIHWGRR